MKKFKLLTSSAIVMTMIVSSIVPTLAYSKEETVYAKMKTDGSQKEVIVSEHLNNDTKEETMNDVSTLENIVNVNGNEKFTQNGNEIVWQTKDGNDIYYQGNTKDKLPISMNISYKLNGKDIKLKDMLGKKGNVEIKIDYINHEKRVVDGEELYVPFVITAGTALSTKTDSQVEVTNGKVMSNGSKNIVVAIAAPGLSENYDNNEELAKLNSITIKYTTTDFQLNSIMTVATPSLLSETDLNFGNLNSLYDNVDKLTSSYQQIVAGGKQLQAGTKVLSEKMNDVVSATSQLEDGSQQLATGMKQLVSGSDTLVEGIDKLDTGAKTLYSGIQTLSEKMQELTAGMNQLQNGLDVLNVAVNGGKYGEYVINNSIMTNINTLTTNLNNVKSNLETIEQNAPSQEEITNLVNYLKQKTDGGPYLATIQKMQTVSTEVNKIAGENGVGGLAGPVQDLTISGTMITQVNSQLSSGVKGITNGINLLNAAISGTGGDNESTLLNGAEQLSSGITQLKDKVPVLTKGISALNAGMTQLANGTSQLTAGTEQLKVEGIDTLANGMDSLVSGMVKFNDEGLNKISDVLINTVKKDVNKTEKLINLSKEYKTFTGVKDDVEAITKFILIVDSKSKK